MEINANKKLYMYHFLTDGHSGIEYCNIYYDKILDAVIVVPDSAFNDFIDNCYDSDIYVKVDQPPYTF